MIEDVKLAQELLPCPFCGNTDPMCVEHPPHTHVIATFMPDHPGSWTIECPGCGVGIIAKTRIEVEDAWNRRTQYVHSGQDAKDATRYRFWRQHYHTNFALRINGDGSAALSFLPGRPMVEVAGPDYEAKVDGALDEAIGRITISQE